MDNLRSSLKAIFTHNSIDKILHSAFSGSGRMISTEYPMRLFLDQGNNCFPHYSLNEIENVYLKLRQDWLHDPYDLSGNNESIYNLLIHFTKQVLTENNGEPFVHYQHLLKWRDVSYNLGEETLAASHFAYMDHRSGRHRDFYSWRPVAFSTNNRLRALLDKGIAENHFHLKGSAPVFDIAWLSLMNNVQSRKKDFDELRKGLRLTPLTSYDFITSSTDIEILVYKAAVIRKHLYESVNALDYSAPKLKDYLVPPSNNTDSFELLMDLGKLQADINTLKTLYGHEVDFNGTNVVPDYAIPVTLHPANNKGATLFSGERLLLYKCFRSIYKKQASFEFAADLFYAYLLIKSTLRRELLQLNSVYGFGNFLKYQNRKEFFIPEGSVYEQVFVNLAVSDTIRFQSIKSLETRLAPKNTMNSLSKQLQKIHKTIGTNVFSLADGSDNYNERFASVDHFHILHFIKRTDDQSLSQHPFIGLIIPRHSKLRREVEQQAKAVADLRESTTSVSEYIRGIDAASSEFDARPEVFAQAFRFLKDHKISGRNNWIKQNVNGIRLMATYHAGEDFHDIVDGLRTIDESINFLNLNQGDRLGHALALGIDASDFYQLKKRKIMIPKQVLLDNIAWLLGKIREFGIQQLPEELSRLDAIYESLFREIYTDNFEDLIWRNKFFSSKVYYDAWKLRGDDPFLYFSDLRDDIYQKVATTYWERCRINYFYPAEHNIRHAIDLKFLYQQYHFNPSIKAKGTEIRQFEITTNYIHLVACLQTRYQVTVAEKNIAIECNPTSNYLISTFKRYAKHPIIKFYNLGLTTDHNKLENCPQLFVSINTDDQGIFSTSLENEYALMAIALEKEKDDNGKPLYKPTMIYQWLDNIRQMGIEQTFKSTNEMKDIGM